MRFDGEGGSWTGNFQRGCRGCEGVFPHPDGRSLIVLAGGRGYVIDPLSRQESNCWGLEVDWAEHLEGEQTIVLADNIRIYILALTGSWSSARISWDGLRHLKITESTVRGEGFSVMEGTWHPFSLNLVTRELTGAIYPRELD